MHPLRALFREAMGPLEREEADKKRTQTSPSSTGLSPHVVWLRERLKNSNFILLKIPTEIITCDHGENLTCMDETRLGETLALTSADIDGLVEAGLVRRKPLRPRPKQRIDYAALQQTYQASR